MSRDVHFTSESDAAELHRRTLGRSWAARLLALAASAAVGMGIAKYYHERRVVPEEIALGEAVQIKPGVWRGAAVNAHALAEYPKLFPPPVSGDGELWVWLGNSQLHAINQLRAEDEVAPVHASEMAGHPVFGLSLPNANLREHLVVGAWALARSQPRWLIVGVVFDDLREYDLRAGLDVLTDTETRAELERSEAGRGLVSEIARNKAAQTQDAQGTSRMGFSPQEISERELNRIVGDAWPMWRYRDQAYARLMFDLYNLRNRALGIDASTKRPVIRARADANMAALGELLSLASRRGVSVLVYVVPVRWDVEPPYYLDAYEEWKVELRGVCERAGARYADLDRAVPDDLWGTVSDDIDFMHFQGPGHRILAERIGEEIERIERDLGPR